MSCEAHGSLWERKEHGKDGRKWEGLRMQGVGERRKEFRSIQRPEREVKSMCRA